MTEEITLTDAEFDEQLPKPVGYMLLIALPQVEEEYESGLLKDSKTIHHERILSTIGLVVDVGNQAYMDEDRFPYGPWCCKGDYVMFRANTGTRFTFRGVEYRLMSDDSVEAVVADPRGISRP
jgi:co-chaperonin GroES (HSP10)